MAKKTVFKWVLVILIVCVLLLISFIFLSAPRNQSQTKIDYVAEYNRITKPADFDPNDNAVPYFDKAFEIMTEEPNALKNFHKLWPGDMNEEQLEIAREWVLSNKGAIDYLNKGITKKYYWKPLEADNNSLFDAKQNYLKQIRAATYLLCLEAKLTAKDGRIEPALGELADVYKMGTFLTGPRFLIDQLVEIAIYGLSVNSAFQVLEHTNPPPAVLKSFQQRIEDLSSDKPFLISFDGEKLMLKDILELYCVGKSPMKLDNLYFKHIFQKTFGRAWAVRESHKADMTYNYLNSEGRKTPWQHHNEGNDVEKTANMMAKSTIYLRLLTPACNRVLFISYRAGVQTDALIAVTAILRYKADKGNYPQDLQTLVDSGYLDKLPMDPFSNGPLVYKLTDNNFILYSLAGDFNDNGGKHDPKWAEEGNGDYVFWPVQEELQNKNKSVRQTVDVNSK